MKISNFKEWRSLNEASGYRSAKDVFGGTLKLLPDTSTIKQALKKIDGDIVVWRFEPEHYGNDCFELMSALGIKVAAIDAQLMYPYIGKIDVKRVVKIVDELDESAAASTHKSLHEEGAKIAAARQVAEKIWHMAKGLGKEVFNWNELPKGWMVTAGTDTSGYIKNRGVEFYISNDRRDGKITVEYR